MASSAAAAAAAQRISIERILLLFAVWCVVLCCVVLCCVGLQLTSRQQQMQTELTAKQQQAGELVRDFKAVEDQLDKVRLSWHTHSCCLNTHKRVFWVFWTGSGPTSLQNMHALRPVAAPWDSPALLSLALHVIPLTTEEGNLQQAARGGQRMCIHGLSNVLNKQMLAV